MHTKLQFHLGFKLISDVLFNIPCIRMKDLKVDSGWPVWFYFNALFNPDAMDKNAPVKGDILLKIFPKYILFTLK